MLIVIRVEEKYLDDGSNLLPLLLAGVHSSGVVSAGVEQDDALFWDFLSALENKEVS